MRIQVDHFTESECKLQIWKNTVELNLLYLYTKREGREHVESSAVLSCLRGKWPFILDHDISSFKMSSSASVDTKVYKVLRVYSLKFI